MVDESSRKRKAASFDLFPMDGGSQQEDIIIKNNKSVSCSFSISGCVVTDHRFRVPLDYTGRLPGEMDLFVRELVSPSNVRRHLPYLLYLQGGPGFECARPVEASGWVKVALNSFRVVLMDQRGTGLSTPVTTSNLSKRGTPEQQAEYLSCFRADSIVQDAEHVRKQLVPLNNNDGKWSLLGQSFGGFCALTYLSMANHGLVEVLLTGGIPPGVDQGCSAKEVYRALGPRVLRQNVKYYQRFPGDVAQVQQIVKFLAAQPQGGLQLPSGTLLTPRLFQMLGLSGLGSGGGFERLHHLLTSFLDGPWEDPQSCVTPTFIKGFENFMSWDTNPLYALLHESIYCQGGASEWSAQQVRDEQFQEQFDAERAAAAGRPVYFTGEMVFPWLFEDYMPLRAYKRTADLLAQTSDWPRLYDVEVLRSNRVPVAAATYVEDMYVDYDLAQMTASQVGNLRQWTTNEYKHSGIRDDGARIFDRLLSITRGLIPLE